MSVDVTKKRPREGPAYQQTAQERYQQTLSFISSLRFSIPLSSLRRVRERVPCPKCGKRRLYYCYDCLAVVHPETHPPPLRLPIRVHVILHPGEHRSKSTSLAASTISPDLHILTYPTVPENLDPNTTLVLYPSKESTSLEDMQDLGSYRDVVFVDSTWQQSKAIARDERVTKFRHVRIPQRTSLFWRYQNNDPSYLATVEAIYYFLREYSVQLAKRREAPIEYAGEVDDLLFYYINQYIQVQQAYAKQTTPTGPAAEAGTTGSDEKRFTSRHFDGYVLRGVSWDAALQSSKEGRDTVAEPRQTSGGDNGGTTAH